MNHLPDSLLASYQYLSFFGGLFGFFLEGGGYFLYWSTFLLLLDTRHGKYRFNSILVKCHV